MKKEGSSGGGFELSTYTLDGEFISDLGVCVYRRRRFRQSWERKRAAFLRSP